MRRSATRLTTIRSAAALVALGLGLGACGGGGSSGAATAAVNGRSEGQARAVEKPQSPARSRHPGQSAGGAPGGSDATGAEAIPPELEHKAGKAAPFLAPGGDNWGLLMKKSSALAPCVDNALAKLKANGTLANLTKRWMSSKVAVPVLK